MEKHPVQPLEQSEYLDMAGGHMKMNIPWRTDCAFNGEERKMLKDFVSSYEPMHLTGVKTANILVVGQIGAGKSSFFNTINSIYQGNITGRALTGQDTESLTKKFRVYHVPAEKHGTSMQFSLCDTMGLEEGNARGMDITDFNFLLDGHVPDQYQFHSKTRLSDNLTIGPGTSLPDKIHAIAIAMDANCVDFLQDSIVEQLREIRRQAIHRALPVIILLTKIDKVCPIVSRDTAKVFHSVIVGKAVETAAAQLQMTASHVLPVKNYDTETHLDDRVDILALSALKHILVQVDGHLEDKLSLQGITIADSQLVDDARPWRPGLQFSQEILGELRNDVDSYQPTGTIPFTRILLLGHTGAGKSSFFNTVNSVYRGNTTAKATVGSESQSTTKKYDERGVCAHKNGPMMNFRVCDTMGLDEVKMDPSTIRCVLKGLITDGYKFREQVVEDIDTKRVLELADKVHVVAIIVDAERVKSLTAGVQEKHKVIIEKCKDMDLPVVVILTKIDKVCDKVRKDITKVYHSIEVSDCVIALAGMLRLQPSQIIPVKNYEIEMKLNQGVDILALSAMKHLLDYADNYIEEHLRMEDGLP